MLSWAKQWKLPSSLMLHGAGPQHGRCQHSEQKKVQGEGAAANDARADRRRPPRGTSKLYKVARAHAAGNRTNDDPAPVETLCYQAAEPVNSGTQCTMGCSLGSQAVGQGVSATLYGTLAWEAAANTVMRFRAAASTGHVQTCLLVQVQDTKEARKLYQRAAAKESADTVF